MNVRVHSLAASSQYELDSAWSHRHPGGTDTSSIYFSSGMDAARIKQKQDDMFLIAGKCGTLIRRDKGAGSRLLANARKS